jgi:MinD superfamily P-loop ATPase
MSDNKRTVLYGSFVGYNTHQVLSRGQCAYGCKFGSYVALIFGSYVAPYACSGMR